MVKGSIALTFCLVLANSIVNSLGDAAANTKCKSLNVYDRLKDDLDITKYYECNTLHDAVSKTCKYGLVFDEATKSCIWSNNDSSDKKSKKDDCAGTRTNGKKCEEGNQYDVMIDACVPEGTYYCESNVKIPDCSMKTYQKKYIADKGNCAGYYFCDANGKRYKGSCPDGYIFNPTEQMCSHIGTLSCTPAIQSTDDSSDDEWANICKDSKDPFVADPRLCNAYIYCNAEGKPRQDFCPFGKYFESGSCVSNAPSTCTCEVYFTNDGTVKKGTVAQQDKTKYYECNGGSRKEQVCEGESVWDASEQSCVM